MLCSIPSDNKQVVSTNVINRLFIVQTFHVAECIRAHAPLEIYWRPPVQNHCYRFNARLEHLINPQNYAGWSQCFSSQGLPSWSDGVTKARTNLDLNLASMGWQPGLWAPGKWDSSLRPTGAGPIQTGSVFIPAATPQHYARRLWRNWNMWMYVVCSGIEQTHS